MKKNIFATNTNEPIRVNEFLKSACRRFVTGIDSFSIAAMNKLASNLSRDCKYDNIYNHLDEIAVLSSYSYFYNFDNSLIKRAAKIMNDNMKLRFNNIVIACLIMVEKSEYFDEIKKNAFMFRMNIIKSIEDKSSIYEDVSSVDKTKDASTQETTEEVTEQSNEEETVEEVNDSPQEVIVDVDKDSTPEFKQIQFMDQFSYNNLLQTVSSLGYEFIEDGVEYTENMYLNRYICLDHSTNTQIYVLIDNNCIYKNGVNMIRITDTSDLFNCPWAPIENIEAMKLLLKTHINNKTVKKIKKLVGYPVGLKRVYRNVDFTQLPNAINFDQWRKLIETLNSNCNDDVFRFRKALYCNGDKLALVGGEIMNFMPQTMSDSDNKYVEHVPQYVVAEF